ncbi:MAG TPA: substrate-binding domain-containing protein [Anaerolineae bacterium]|nr:substrate-binding domain-containing protein [Anaerolineae bacterium]HQH37077.1 substrate-binding domain-containing protein [Anaerolineae bacterium]
MDREVGQRLADVVATSHKKRPALGIVTHQISGATAWWLGAAEVARQQDVDLFILNAGNVGAEGNIDDNIPYAVHHLIDPERLDALILVQWWPARQVFEAFYNRYYRPLPVVNLHRHYEGYPGVSVDNSKGMMSLLRHLIEVHGYRRLAYIAGPPGNPSAETRYAAYVAALAEYDIPLDENLIVPGDFSAPSGANAVRMLLDERGLRPALDFEVIVAANDYMALTALEELQQRGIRVPLDVALVGFDDVADSAYAMPALTTVRMPNYEMGQTAAEIALAMIKGEPFEPYTLLPGEVVVRQSCGCFTSPLADSSESIQMPVVTGAPPAGGPPDLAGGPPGGPTPEQLQYAIAELSQSIGPAGAVLQANWAEEILTAFSAALAVPPDGTSAASRRLLGVLYDILRRLYLHGYDMLGVGRTMLFVLRRCMQPTLADFQQMRRAENVWQHAMAFMTDVAHQMQSVQQHAAETYLGQLHAIGEKLITTFDMTHLLDLIARELPRLDIPGCYIALYEGPRPSHEEVRLVMAYNAQGRNPQGVEGRRYRAGKLLPDELLLPERPAMWVVTPLYFQEVALGFALFEAEKMPGEVYETLGHQISSALMGSLLVQQQEEAQREAEAARRRAQATLSEVLTTRSITDQVRQAADTEAVLRVALESLSQVLGATMAVARLGTREQLLEAAAGVETPESVTDKILAP